MEPFIVSLDGEQFRITVDTNHKEEETFPLTMVHVPSTMEYETVTEGGSREDVLGDYGFAEDLSYFYRRLFGRPARAGRFEEVS